MENTQKDQIDVSPIEATPNTALCEMQLHVNFITIGEIESDDIKLYIRQETLYRLEKYSAEDTSHERGSVLIGEYSENSGKLNIMVTDFIEAKYTDASASTLTFTHETWDYIHKEHASRFPSFRMVGWQHTHPNYGIFLSNYDMFIQENFFNMPFQIAYVVDPIQKTRGFFQWKNGKVVKLTGYYIFDEIGKSIKPPVDVQLIQKKSKSVSKRVFIWTCISIVAVLGISIAIMRAIYIKELTVLQQNNIAQQATVEEQLPATVQADTAANTSSTDNSAEVKSLQDLLIDNTIAFGDIDAIQNVIAQVESNHISVSDKDMVLEQLNSRLETLEARAAFITQSILSGKYTLFSKDYGYIDFDSTHLTTTISPRIWVITQTSDTTFTIKSGANTNYSWVIYGSVMEQGVKVELSSRSRINAPVVWQLFSNESGEAYLSPAEHPELFLTYKDGFFLADLNAALEGTGEYPFLPINLGFVE